MLSVEKQEAKRQSQYKTIFVPLYVTTWIVWCLNLLGFVSIFINIGENRSGEALYAFMFFIILLIPLLFLLVALIYASAQNYTLKLAGYIFLLFFGVMIPVFNFIYLIIVGVEAKKPITEESIRAFDKQQIMNRRRTNTDILRPVDNFVTPNDITVKLQKLESLKNKGLIDDEDYKKLKEDIIKSSL